jgi:hypothetical protein
MKEFLLVVSLIGLVWAGNHLYKQGLRDGEQHYKQSHRMYMALKSAYHFGYMDCHDGRVEDWDGNDE